MKNNTSNTAAILTVAGAFLYSVTSKKKTVTAPTPTTTKTGSPGSNLVATGPTTTTPATTPTTTPAARMVNGVPVWLTSLGQSRQGNTNETSLWVNGDIVPNIKIDIVGGGTASGTGWVIGMAQRATAYVLREWDSVLRLNPTVLGLGGILNNKEYYGTISNPDAPEETITVKFKTANGDSNGIELIPLVPVVIPPVVVITTPVTPVGVTPVGSTTDLDTAAGVQPSITGHVFTTDGNAGLLQLGLSQNPSGYVVPYNKSNWVAPGGYKIWYQVDNGPFIEDLMMATPSEHGDFILITMYVSLSSVPGKAIYSQLNHFTNPVNSIGVMY